MNKKRIWIDCDPGIDDAAAIFAAIASDEIEVVGISTVCGNATLENTYNNARNLVHLANADIDVYKGCSKPLNQELVTAPYIHGENGLSEVILKPSSKKHTNIHVVDALYDAYCKDDDLIVVAVGPLTNIALACLKYPKLKKVKNLIIMGGGFRHGNYTPSAEFNIYVDAVSAKIVFDNYENIKLFPLDVTMQAYISYDEMDELAKINHIGKFLVECFETSKKFCQKINLPGVCLHDLCTIIYLINNDLFEMDEAFVNVEIQSDLTYGQTISDLYSDKQFEYKNCEVYLSVKRKEFIDYFFTLIKKLPR